ncbi:pyridoxal phosphate-dependent transferase [Scenedesmus sp. NREL 46B-D3]|nr:pyridoxal phosphate-dependent transferase [Scenedesmus sp. NREL 46B-D3]
MLGIRHHHTLVPCSSSTVPSGHDAVAEGCCALHDTPGHVRGSLGSKSSSHSTVSTLPGRATKQHARACSSKQPVVRFIHRPERDYKPNNPKWLVEAASWRPEDIPQQLLVECPALTAFKEQAAALFTLELGTAECRQQLFALDEQFPHYLNHGSYGATFRLALEVQNWYRQLMEQEPVRFMETVAMAGLVRAVADVAGCVGASWQDVVPVVNATAAVNAVVASLQLRKGDLLLMSNATYPAVRSALARAAAAAGAGLLELTFELEDLLDEARILACFRAALRAGGRRLKLAVIDHVVSFPPVVMPVQQICSMCRGAGVPVLVDGALAVGCLPDLAIPSLGCQYYTSNLHKWMCTPKGAALLWVQPGRQDAVLPLVCSHGYGLGFRGEFLWQGTADITPWLAVPASLAVMQALHPQRVMDYNHSLVRRAVQLLQQAWGTHMVLGIKQNGTTAGMAAVQMPWPLALPRSSSCSETSTEGETAAAGGSIPGNAPAAAAAEPTTAVAAAVAVHGVAGDADGAAAWAHPSAAAAAALNKYLREVQCIEVPVTCVAGQLFVRISAQIYNSIADYEALAGAVLQLAAAAAATEQQQ